MTRSGLILMATLVQITGVDMTPGTSSLSDGATTVGILYNRQVNSHPFCLAFQQLHVSPPLFYQTFYKVPISVTSNHLDGILRLSPDLPSDEESRDGAVVRALPDAVYDVASYFG